MILRCFLLEAVIIYSWKKYKECVNEETARARKSHLKKHQDRKAFENSFLDDTQI